MPEFKLIELKQSIFADNDADADKLRRELKVQRTCLLNLMASPGAGKTTMLTALVPYLQDKLKWGVMEADIDSDTDAQTISLQNIPVIQLHTGGMCHLDTIMKVFVHMKSVVEGSLLEYWHGLQAYSS